MIDRSLNYGRPVIERFLSSTTSFHTVLDIGAGGGDDLLLARRKNPQASLHAIECHEDNARRLAERGIITHCLDIERTSFPFKECSIDIVMANQVLEHTKELFWIFHEISRILSIGGVAIIGVPNLASMHNRILLAVGRQPSQIKTASAHVRGFTRGDFLKFVSACFPGGYELKGFRGSNFYPFPPMIAKPLAMAFPTLAWSIFFKLEKAREYRGEFLEFPVNEALESNFYLGEK